MFSLYDMLRVMSRTIFRKFGTPGGIRTPDAGFGDQNVTTTPPGHEFLEVNYTRVNDRMFIVCAINNSVSELIGSKFL